MRIGFLSLPVPGQLNPHGSIGSENHFAEDRDQAGKDRGCGHELRAEKLNCGVPDLLCVGPTIYSYRSATIGSTRIARLAGM